MRQGDLAVLVTHRDLPDDNQIVTKRHQQDKMQ
jgi:hypothetical protein